MSAQDRFQAEKDRHQARVDYDNMKEAQRPKTSRDRRADMVGRLTERPNHEPDAKTARMRGEEA